MYRLPIWVLTQNRPSIYDSESSTPIQMVAKLYQTMQDLINEYNKHVDEVNKTLELNETEQREFESRIEETILNHFKCIDLKIEKLNTYLHDNVSTAIIDEINRQLSTGELIITQEYDETTESLNFVFTRSDLT